MFYYFIFHLTVSVHKRKNMQALELKIPPIILVAFISIFMWLLSFVTPTISFHNPWKMQMAAVIGILGIVISLLGVLAFRSAKTTTDPRVPQQTTNLVCDGIYQLSRNPMYLGFFFVLLGWAIYLSHGLAFLLLPVFILYMNRFQISPEERFMLEKFGTQYSSYIRKVRRWI